MNAYAHQYHVNMSEMIQPRTDYTRLVHQQELEALAGADTRFLCAPSALLHLARLHNYLITPETFVNNMEWAYWNGATTEWNRAGLARMMRERYGVASVSWWSAATGMPFSRHDTRRMQRAGYVDSLLESAFLTDVVSCLEPGVDGVLSLVSRGVPVIATVEPGFGANRSTHAVVLTNHDREQGTMTIFDPDARNETTEYPDLYVREYLSPVGACTVILPHKAP